MYSSHLVTLLLLVVVAGAVACGDEPLAAGPTPAPVSSPAHEVIQTSAPPVAARTLAAGPPVIHNVDAVRPFAVSNVQVVNKSRSSGNRILLSWTPVQSQPPVSGYSVAIVSGTADFNSSPPSTSSSSSSSSYHEFWDLVDGTYTVGVRAQRPGGDGGSEWTSWSYKTTAVAALRPVTNVRAAVGSQRLDSADVRVSFRPENPFNRSHVYEARVTNPSGDGWALVAPPAATGTVSDHGGGSLVVRNVPRHENAVPWEAQVRRAGGRWVSSSFTLEGKGTFAPLSEPIRGLRADRVGRAALRVSWTPQTRVSLRHTKYWVEIENTTTGYRASQILDVPASSAVFRSVPTMGYYRVRANGFWKEGAPGGPLTSWLSVQGLFNHLPIVP